VGSEKLVDVQVVSVPNETEVPLIVAGKILPE
jgi:hypothetical protein